MTARDVELLAPAGSFDVALAAFAAGADAVYLGLDCFSARAQAVNFSPDELRRLLAHARAQTPPRRVYVTFNVVVDDAALPEAIAQLALLDELHPDGLIVQDLGVARLVRRHFPSLALHASTQLVAHNLEGVLALEALGFTRVVLARELSLDDVRAVARRTHVEIETFVHGALCYSLSGLCLFSALERGRSGNRGQCAYCCRQSCVDASGATTLPFSMRDLRLDEHLDALRDAGVVSLKIEGRMKSALYVASVVKRYRELLDAGRSATSRADLETVFSRRTTTLYVQGYDNADVVDPTSLGHLGAAVGTVKRVTRDRENRAWVRFHTTRALEKHDGLQFAEPSGGNGARPLGAGISEMRLALARHGVCSVPADSDVEIFLPDETAAAVKPGMTVFCSASNAVKRRFPVPSFRPSECPAGAPVDVVVHLAADRFAAEAPAWNVRVEAPAAVEKARDPSRTGDAVRRAFAKLGETDWALGACTVDDPDGLFAPASILNDLRRGLVEALDTARAARRAEKIAAARAEFQSPGEGEGPKTGNARPRRTAKIRLRQEAPEGDWDEVVVAIGHAGEIPETWDDEVRLALPPFTKEGDWPRLRTRVKGLLRAGFAKWEAADLAGLRLLRQLGVDDLTADWTLYAFNRVALAALGEAGVRRIVCSPENSHDNLAQLARAAARDAALPRPEFLVRQSTPLFLSLTPPAGTSPDETGAIRFTQAAGREPQTILCRLVDGLWTTTREEPRRFAVPAGDLRFDFSWDG